jgi:hypothetical protein
MPLRGRVTSRHGVLSSATSSGSSYRLARALDLTVTAWSAHAGGLLTGPAATPPDPRTPESRRSASTARADHPECNLMIVDRSERGRRRTRRDSVAGGDRLGACLLSSSGARDRPNPRRTNTLPNRRQPRRSPPRADRARSRASRRRQLHRSRVPARPSVTRSSTATRSR